jgi:flavodoxin
MKGGKMRKALKIILIVVLVLVLFVAAFAAVVFLDLAAYTATSSEVRPATGTQIGTAIVAYDPGLSGTAKTVASKVTDDLVAAGYTVTFAGIKSNAATNTSAYNIIVVGGPIYAGSPTVSVKDFLSNLNIGSGTVVGVFGSGSGESAPEDIKNIQDAIAGLKNGDELSGAVVVKIGQSEDLNVRAQDFVNQLTQ